MGPPARAGVGEAPAPVSCPLGDNRRVGFNPFRPSRRRTADYAVLAAAFVVVALLLAWAVVPR